MLTPLQVQTRLLFVQRDTFVPMVRFGGLSPANCAGCALGV